MVSNTAVMKLSKPCSSLHIIYLLLMRKFLTLKGIKNVIFFSKQ